MQAFRPCLLALMAALLPLSAGAETPEEAKARIENQTMNNTRPSDGYRYLSGNLPNFHNHPAIYAFQRGGKRMLMVVGRGVSDVYPMSQADTAFRAYQDLLRQVGYIQ